MEVKNFVTISVKTTVRNCFELFTITLVILLPLALTAFAILDTDISRSEISICGVAGTLVWWYICWCIFWFIV